MITQKLQDTFGIDDGKPELDRCVYLVALGYSGQQAAGINALISLQCWAAYSGQPVKIVEPVVRNSRIISPFQFRNADLMGLSDFFDMKHLNNASKTEGFPQFVERTDFLKMGSKNVVFIQFGNESGEQSILWPAADATQPCFTTQTKKAQVNRMIRDGFCIVKIVSTKATSLTRSKLRKILGKWNQRSVTLVVSNWKAPLSPQPECKRVGRSSKGPQFYPSPRLLHDARRYTDTYIESALYNAVMIRLEHAAILTEKFPESYSIQGCLKEVLDVVSAIEQGGDRIPMVAADIGSYGSSSWEWAVRDKTRLTTGMNDTRTSILELLQGRMTLEEWEGTFVEAAGGVTDRGYIAALQRTIASRAECLVLMGGGNFQDMALIEHLRTHEKKCVHLVCIENKEEMLGRMTDY